jgi:hypothetical protein
MTAQDVYELAIALIDQTESPDVVEYAQRAPALIDVLQHELAFYEGATLTRAVNSLDDTLELSGDTAERIMPYGLAASFALADKNSDMYADYSAMYRALIRTIRHGETDAADEYAALSGMY